MALFTKRPWEEAELMRWLGLVMGGGSRGPTRGRKGRLAISMVIPSNKGSDPVSRKLAPFLTLHSSQGK